MALGLASPGITIKEIDLTLGRVDNNRPEQVAGIAGPFEKGPVEDPITIRSTKELLTNFGPSYTADNQYEYWLSASSYMEYGGTVNVVRSDGTNLRTANYADNANKYITTLKIKNYDDYENNFKDLGTYVIGARTPGSWANGYKVCAIDAGADQVFSGVTTTGISVGAGVTQSIGIATISNSNGTTTTINNGVLYGKVTKVGSGSIEVKVVGLGTTAGATQTAVQYDDSSVYRFTSSAVVVGLGSTSVAASRGSFDSSVTSHNVGAAVTLYPLAATTTVDNAGSASIAPGDTNFNLTSVAGVTTGGFLAIGQELMVISTFNPSTNQVTVGRAQAGTATTHVDGSTVRVIGVTSTTSATLTQSLNNSNDDVSFTLTRSNDGTNSITANSFLLIDGEFLQVTSVLLGGTQVPTVTDWYQSQTVGGTTLYWNNIAPKPRRTSHGASVGALNDELHFVVLDSQNNVVEKVLGLSKGADALQDQENNYFKKVIQERSQYFYVGQIPSGDLVDYDSGNGSWAALDSTNVKYDLLGNKTYTLSSGKDYSGTNNVGGFSVSTTNLFSALDLFADTENSKLDFIIGPGVAGKIDSVSLANKMISIAELRKDCIACISPYRGAVLNVTDTATITNNIIDFFSDVSSSSYAVFDSGYKYVRDSQNALAPTYQYIPCNADIAGLMAKTKFDIYPWYSPAGVSRGQLKSVAKLAYNPKQSQRDLLYTNRVNPIISSAGQGVVLFGDKTALAVSSAFDRINVRRLFLQIEEDISNFAKSQLFEFNDEITRTKFKTLADSYLNDVLAKRGVQEFLVVCDETNNTPDVIDRNEFVADVYIKPTRSINFIGLTFVATRTGVSFAEIVGNV